MKRFLITFALLLGLLAACASPNQTLIPTPYPPEYLPTVIALTADASIPSPVAPEDTVQNEIDFPTKTLEPSITPSPIASLTSTTIPGHDLGAVRFSTPGPMSKVTSPIQVRAMVITGSSERVQVELFGEDGRLLVRELRKLQAANHTRRCTIFNQASF